MALVKVGYFYYDTEEIVGKCPECGGDMYEFPALIRYMKLTKQELQDFRIRLWTIGFCPVCVKSHIISFYGRLPEVVE